MGKPAGKHRPSNVIARQREQRALELRRWGATFLQIGNDIGVSEAGAAKIVSRALARMDIDSEEIRTELRKQEVDRLDNYLQLLAVKIKTGEPAVIDRALRIQERRARLLGLDAPVRTTNEHHGPGGVPIVSSGYDLRRLELSDLLQIQVLIAKAAVPLLEENNGDDATADVPGG